MISLFACATATNKSTVNQDYCLTVRNEHVGFAGVIIADGIGSHKHAELSAKHCSEALKLSLEEIRDPEALKFERIFEKVKASLVRFSWGNDLFALYKTAPNHHLGTTLMCALDLHNTNEYLLAYAGNGSIWHTGGNFNTFGPHRYLPWNSINLLNPHSVDEEGKAALTRYLSVSDAPCVPTVLKVSKDKLHAGELIIITSDGVFSNDQVPVGEDDNGTLWIKGEDTMRVLYSHLSAFLSNNPKQATNEDLCLALKKYLTAIKERGLMHDDTTIGVIVSGSAITFHQQKWEKRNTLVSDETH